MRQPGLVRDEIQERIKQGENRSGGEIKTGNAATMAGEDKIKELQHYFQHKPQHTYLKVNCYSQLLLSISK